MTNEAYLERCARLLAAGTVVTSAALVALAGATPRASGRAIGDLDPPPRGAYAAWVALQATPDPNGAGETILGTQLRILSDGTAPWEDRPFTVPGVGEIPGSPRVADPGDDLGPADRIVRSWDSVTYRLALSVRGGTAEAVTAEVRLGGPVAWDARQLDALRRTSCPGGASLAEEGRLLRCEVGRLEAPPAVTLALDLVARVAGDALQGEAVDAEVTVRARGVRPDPEPSRCPEPREGGCDARAPRVTVSAAPAAALRKYPVGVRSKEVGGVAGRSLLWRLEAVLGADGDLRGTSALAGAPWVIEDWWRASARDEADLDLPITLRACRAEGGPARWDCRQPGGTGSPVQVTLDAVDLVAAQPDGLLSTQPRSVGSVEVELWVPEADVLAVKEDVRVLNCFATRLGEPGESAWWPTDAAGQPNLNGRAEPVHDNCAVALLPVPRPPRAGAPRRPVPPGGPGVPEPGPPPRATPTPEAIVAKRYLPLGAGREGEPGHERHRRGLVARASRRALAGGRPVRQVGRLDAHAGRDCAGGRDGLVAERGGRAGADGSERCEHRVRAWSLGSLAGTRHHDRAGLVRPIRGRLR